MWASRALLGVRVAYAGRVELSLPVCRMIFDCSRGAGPPTTWEASPGHPQACAFVFRLPFGEPITCCCETSSGLLRNERKETTCLCLLRRSFLRAQRSFAHATAQLARRLPSSQSRFPDSEWAAVTEK